MDFSGTLFPEIFNQKFGSIGWVWHKLENSVQVTKPNLTNAPYYETPFSWKTTSKILKVKSGISQKFQGP